MEKINVLHTETSYGWLHARAGNDGSHDSSVIWGSEKEYLSQITRTSFIHGHSTECTAQQFGYGWRMAGNKYCNVCRDARFFDWLASLLNVSSEYLLHLMEQWETGWRTCDKGLS